MKKSNENGFVNIIIYFVILIVFGFTVYACLDILGIVEVPEKYSLSKWLDTYVGNSVAEAYKVFDESGDDTVKSIAKKGETEISYEDVEKPNLSMREETIAPENVATSFSYYAQLDDYAKIIYTELEKNLENMKSGTYNVDFGTTFDDLLHTENGEEVLNQSFQLAINALNFDNPELFFIDISKLFLLTKISTRLWTTTYTVEIGTNNGRNYWNETFTSEEQIEDAILAIEAQKREIEKYARGSAENQIKVVHDSLVELLEYDSTISEDNIYNIYGALINRSTVCEGYARAFKAMMDDLNIPCLIACGIGQNSSGQTESHAWNYVMIDGKWYAIDVTWDDPIIIGSGRVSEDINYRYYLKGSRDFFENHTENGEIVGNSSFRYPVLSEENY